VERNAQVAHSPFRALDLSSPPAALNVLTSFLRMAIVPRDALRMQSGQFRPGDQVPVTGIYSVMHYQHRVPHDVFATGGEEFPRCHRCGDRVSFALVQSANRIDQDHDFGPGRQERSG
jgi:hypothetical protein